MMLALGALSLICHKVQLSNIVAALVVGLVVGGSGWDISMQLDAELDNAFIELGNVLVLFFAGLSTNYSSFEIYWKQICLISCVQLVTYIGTFAGLGIGLGLCPNAISSFYFGLACAMSSTLLVHDHLRRKEENRQLHSRILSGVMVIQDSAAACSFVIIEAFRRIRNPDPGPDDSMEALFRMDRAGAEAGRAIGILLALLAALALLHRFALDRLFRLYRREDEMLSIGSMAYALGIAAICQLSGFSAMAGAYCAGLSLAFLPTRGHIASRIAALRGFGARPKTGETRQMSAPKQAETHRRAPRLRCALAQATARACATHVRACVIVPARASVQLFARPSRAEAERAVTVAPAPWKDAGAAEVRARALRPRLSTF